MRNGLGELSKFRRYLIENCKHLNTGRSPLFVSISLVAGIAIVTGSALLAPKTTIGQIGIGVGSVTTVVNAAQLIYKKYI